MRNSDCSLCVEISGQRTGICYDYDSIIESRQHILQDYGENVLVPSLGALCPGHVLLCPKKHLASYRSAQAANVARDLRQAIDSVKSIFGGQVVAFEHGTASDGKCRSACIDHAHIHVLPTAMALRPFINIPGVLASQHYYLPPTNMDYTYLRDADGYEFLIAVRESQYLRKVWSSVNGALQWNWRLWHGVENIVATIETWNDARNGQQGGQPDAFGAGHL